jgi:hypothetical protein
MIQVPFRVGERVHPDQLAAWTYTGLCGKPGKDKDAVRRFRKGLWVLEVQALENPGRATRVVSIRSADEDNHHWRETRQRLMRNRDH